jgi:peptidoglycan/LPS O-acetylase OafA/YrhL
MRRLAAIGRASYSIYLWHVLLAYYPIQILAARLIGTGPDWSEWSMIMAAYVSLALGVGVLMSRTIEQPVLALRDRMLSPRSPAACTDFGIPGRE